MEPSTRVLVVATTTRTDALDPTLVAPGRLDHLIEIALPDTDDQREILELIRVRTEKNAGRQIFAPIDYDKVLPVMGGMSGADISVILRRTLEAKVHAPGVEAVVRYVRPARLDDLLEVRCWVSERRRASFRFSYEIVSEDGATVATGSTLHACLDPATSKMIAVPAWLGEIMPVVGRE